MKKSRIVAISAICTAFTVLVLFIGTIYSPLDLTALLIASIIVMVPLSKGSTLSAVLTVIASSVLSLFMCAFKFHVILPYALFFGLHPIVNYVVKKRGYKKLYWFIIKDVWFVLTMLLMQYFVHLIVIDVAFIQRFMVWFIIVFGALLFFPYDYMIIKFQQYIDALVKRLKI